MRLDKIDRKLLFELDNNARQTNKHLAKKLRVSPEVIRYRIKRFEEEKVIRYYMAIISPEKLGYYHYEVYFRFQDLEEAKEKELIAYLKKKNNILWLSSCMGHYDLVFSVIAKDNLEFSRIIEDILENYGNNIFERNIQSTVQIPHFTRNYLTGKKITQEIPYKSGREKKEPIDEIDFKILKYVMDNAREPITKIADKTGETIDVVKYRLRKLEKKGIINTYRPFIDKEKIGHQLNQILFRFRNLKRSVKIRFIEFVKQFDKSVYVLDTMGSYDLILELEPKDQKQLNIILKSIRNEFSESILEYETITITKEHQMDYFKIDERDFFS